MIFVFLDGGPSTIDMWDMKPGAAAEIRGEFRPIATAVPGLQVCEHLPKLARVADRLTVVRSLHHVIIDHPASSRYILTGRLPGPAADSPALGPLAASLLGATPGIPASLLLKTGYEYGLTMVGAGRLGPAYGSLRVDLSGDRHVAASQLSGVSLPDSLPVKELEERERLRRRLDGAFAALDRSGLPGRLDRFQQQAIDILRSDKVRRALDVNAEPARVRAAYGLLDANRLTGDERELACGLLAARRLIEAGARFVTVGSRGDWDTHRDQFGVLRKALLPTLDRGLPALIADLDDRGLLDETVVYCVGEFGRTPRVNSQGGRDHWPGAMAALVAGGGFRRGYVHGQTDAQGVAPDRDQCTPESMAATVFQALGFPPTHRQATLGNAPMFPEGRVVNDLLIPTNDDPPGV